MSDLYNDCKSTKKFTFSLAATLLADENEKIASAWFEQLRHDATEGLLHFDKKVVEKGHPSAEWSCYVDDPQFENVRYCKYIDWGRSKVARADLVAWCLKRKHSPVFLFGVNAELKMSDLFNDYKSIDVFNFSLAATLLADENEKYVSMWFTQLEDDATEGLLRCEKEVVKEDHPNAELTDCVEPQFGNLKVRSYIDWGRSKVARDDLTAWCLARGHSPAFLFGVRLALKPDTPTDPWGFLPKGDDDRENAIFNLRGAQLAINKRPDECVYNREWSAEAIAKQALDLFETWPQTPEKEPKQRAFAALIRLWIKAGMANPNDLLECKKFE